MAQQTEIGWSVTLFTTLSSCCEIKWSDVVWLWCCSVCRHRLESIACNVACAIYSTVSRNTGGFNTFWPNICKMLRPFGQCVTHEFHQDQASYHASCIGFREIVFQALSTPAYTGIFEECFKLIPLVSTLYLYLILLIHSFKAHHYLVRPMSSIFEDGYFFSLIWKRSVSTSSIFESYIWPSTRIREYQEALASCGRQPYSEKKFSVF